jgi:ribosomal protein L7Ae-like RNA K-turn-binding protein
MKLQFVTIAYSTHPPAYIVLLLLTYERKLENKVPYFIVTK